MRLHSSLPGEAARYATLSYCWGGEQPHRTTKHTLSKYLDEVSLLSIPKTLQDAVFVTRQVGIRYLWIDSLCIIQDDPIDMASELSTMHTIYKNSTVVIAAQFPTIVHQGFLQRPLKEAIKLPFCHGGGVKGNVHLAFDPRIAKCEALNTRAWVFQEAVLARRLLIYSRTGVAWSCISDHIQSSRFEPHKMAFLVEQIAVARGMFGHPDHRGHLDPRYGIVHMNPLEAWHGLVENYSSLDLTFFNDKLPALAGIAGEFQSIINDRYVAGMWARDLAHQLA
jgi:hypothetical protein